MELLSQFNTSNLEDDTTITDSSTTIIDSNFLTTSVMVPIDQKFDDNILYRIVDMLNIPTYYKHCLPSVVLRNTSSNIKSNMTGRYRWMVNFIVKCFENIATSVCPCPTQMQLMVDDFEWLQKNIHQESQIEEINNENTELQFSNVTIDYERKWRKLSDTVCGVSKLQKKYQ